jgi:hypothetical protein
LDQLSGFDFRLDLWRHDARAMDSAVVSVDTTCVIKAHSPGRDWVTRFAHTRSARSASRIEFPLGRDPTQPASIPPHPVANRRKAAGMGKQETEPMAYSDHEQALRVASAISGVTTGCCLRYGLFASILRQPVTELDEAPDAFHR